ncbi:phosphatase PAP2 family protein [Novilysobacter arseniciresistens]|uniref:phosphatase PAP2 family protein n=1 Tax=Novilysobacter arseniciresistens TaxID=1385522 RepID=UPI0009DCA53D|nr:phosphatase PAP2 family protein [Lysobacter arseniciresistens]
MVPPERPDPEGLHRLPLTAALRLERGLLREVWQRHGGRLLLVFVGLLLPMWGFAELADEIRESEPLAFDEPLLLWARSLAGPGMDRWLVAVTDAGYLYGVVPADVLLVVALLLWRRLPEATFAAIALAGSALLNVGTKLLFARERPSLWESIAPEVTYSFPSGHAMGSATLAWVLVLLAWRTRWRWPVLLLVAPFVVLVGFSRVYLGVHYPSDILAGWAAASVWAAASYFAVFRFRSVPWHR